MRVAALRKKYAFLHVSYVERYDRIGHPEEMFEDHTRDLQGVEFSGLQVCQDSLDRSTNRFLSFMTEYGSSAFTSQVEKGPSRFAGFSIHRGPIETGYRSPT